MTTLRAGTLRDRIRIQARSDSHDEWGSPMPEAWDDIAPNRIAADVRHRSGLSTIKADAEVSIVRASIRIRRRADVTAGMRVLHSGQIYDIEAVLPGETREYIDLVCKLIQGKAR